MHSSAMFTKMEASASHAVCTPEQTFAVGVYVCVCLVSPVL